MIKTIFCVLIDGHFSMYFLTINNIVLNKYTNSWANTFSVILGRSLVELLGLCLLRN